MTNPDPGFIAIRKQIFSHFDHNTLKVCQELFGERNGEDWNGDWDLWLEKRFLEHFQLLHFLSVDFMDQCDSGLLSTKISGEPIKRNRDSCGLDCRNFGLSHPLSKTRCRWVTPSVET